MMNYRILSGLSLFLVFAHLSAQTVHLEFPYLAGYTYDFKIFQGEKQVTLKHDTIPKDGIVNLSLPEEYKTYQGMATWYLADSPTGGGLDLILNREDFSVSCKEPVPTAENIVYRGTQENIYDKSMYRRQQALFEKHDAALSVQRAYPAETEFSRVAKREYEAVKMQYQVYTKSLSESDLYAAKFRQIVNITLGIGRIMTINEQEKAADINDFITQELDFDILYTSNHWTGVISSWVQMHSSLFKDDAQLSTNVRTILSRIKSDQVYTDFVASLTKNLTKEGKDEVIAALLAGIKAGKRLQHFEGPLSIYRLDLRGKAPDLQLPALSGKGNPAVLKTDRLGATYSLIFFYRSGCGPCETAVQSLTANYQKLTAKGIKIISFSADTDPDLYRQTSKSFRWKDHYADFLGMKGPNFLNYGVIGTPTFFILDRKGIIIKKMSSVEEILTWMK